MEERNQQIFELRGHAYASESESESEVKVKVKVKVNSSTASLTIEKILLVVTKVKLS